MHICIKVDTNRHKWFKIGIIWWWVNKSFHLLESAVGDVLHKHSTTILPMKGNKISATVFTKWRSTLHMIWWVTDTLKWYPLSKVIFTNELIPTCFLSYHHSFNKIHFLFITNMIIRYWLKNRCRNRCRVNWHSLILILPAFFDKKIMKTYNTIIVKTKMTMMTRHKKLVFIEANSVYSK